MDIWYSVQGNVHWVEWQKQKDQMGEQHCSQHFFLGSSVYLPNLVRITISNQQLEETGIWKIRLTLMLGNTKYSFYQVELLSLLCWLLMFH